MAKRAPITIDVQPQELEVERPVVLRAPKDTHPSPFVKQARPRSPVQQVRDLQRMGRIVQRPDFWIGLVADLWMKGPR